MHKHHCILACVALIVATTAFAQIPTITRSVECSTPPVPIVHDLIRGESANLVFRYYQTNVPFIVSTATNVELRYRSSDLPAGYFHSLPGSVASNAATFFWSPASQTAATNYLFSVVLSGATGANMRAYGTIKQIGAITGSSTNVPTLYAPTPWSIAIQILSTGLTVSATATNVHFADLLDVPPIWPGTATDSVARSAASAASQAASNALESSAGWLTSVAFGITSGITNLWTQGYTAGTNWLTSAAAGITSAMISTWNTAYSSATNAIAQIAAETNRATQAEALLYPRSNPSNYIVNGQSSVTCTTLVATYIYRYDPFSPTTAIDLNAYRLYGSDLDSYWDWSTMIGTDDGGTAWIDGKLRQLKHSGGWPSLDWSGNGTPGCAPLWYNSVNSVWQFETRVAVTNFPLKAFGGIEAYDPGGISDYALLLRGTTWAEANAFKVRLSASGSTNVLTLSGPDGALMTLSDAPDTFPGVFDFYGPFNIHGGGNVVTQGVKIAACTNADYATSAGTATDPTARTASSNAMAAASAASQAATNAQTTANAATSNAATAQATADLSGPYLTTVIRLSETNPVIQVNSVSNYFRWAPTNSGACNVTITPLGTNIATVGVLHGWLQHTNTVSWATNILFNVTGTHTNAAPSLPQDWRFTIELSEGQVCLHLAPTNNIARP